jgi:prolyl oligopeptidase
MTAYGGFDVSETPAFRDDAVVWAEHGGVFAMPALRGGGEFGEDWHHAGMLEKKQNVFDDFFAAAEWLIANHYTQPQRLAIIGRSNGGLLMGAAMTQRPDLFGAIVCGYPLLDMVRYQNFLVARFWVTEYGSSDSPQQFPFIYAYSPYHHVVKGTKYPGRAVSHRRQRYSRSSPARAENDRRNAGSAGKRQADPADVRHEARSQ